MQIKVSTLKKYVEIVGVGQSGDFEAKTIDNNLFASIAGNGGTALVKAFLPCDEDIILRANSFNIKSKYLDNFNNTDIIDVITDENVITLSDDKLTLTLAQVTEEAASRNTSDLKKVLPPVFVSINVNVDDLKRIKRVADSHKEFFIKIEIDGDNVRFIIKNKATLLPDAEIIHNESSDIYTSIIHIMMIDDIFSHAVGNIKLEFVEDKTYPIRFEFDSIDEIKVCGFVMPSTDE